MRLSLTLNKLNVINIPPSTLKTKTLFDKNKKNLYILFSVRYYCINIKILNQDRRTCVEIPQRTPLVHQEQ